MECCEPGAIRDEELIASLEGDEVRPAVIEHLARCPHCASKLEAFRRLSAQLTTRLYRWDCPPSQVLGEYHLQMLDHEWSFAVASHLRACVLCAAEIATLTEFLVGDPLLEMVPSSQRQVEVLLEPARLQNYLPLKETWDAFAYVQERFTKGLQRIIATFQPVSSSLAFQRTPFKQSSPWPRNYAAEGVIISLQLEEDPVQRGALQLIGLISTPDLPIDALQGHPVRLAALDGPIAVQTVDDLGNFVFSSLASATYTLELQLLNKVIVIEQLYVQPDR